MADKRGRDRGSAVLWSTLRAQRWRLIVGSVLFIGHQGGEALVPVVIGLAIDRAVDGGTVTDLAIWLGVLGVLFALFSPSYRFGVRHVVLAQARAERTLRVRVAARVLDARGGAEAGRLPGALVSVATSDVKQVAEVGFWLPHGVAAAAGVTVAGVALLVQSVPLGLLVLLGTPPLLWLVHRLGRPLQARSEAQQERAALASGVAADLVTGVRVLKGIGAEDVAVRRYRATSRESLAATLRATRALAGYQGAVTCANGLFLALVALLGGWLAITGRLSVGGLVAAVGLAQFLQGPLTVFGWVGSRLAVGRASAGRIAATLDAAPSVVGGTSAPASPVLGGVRLRGLRHERIDGLDLTVEPGELVGVVVPDPAQAATLLRCLRRDVDPDGGDVELDGTRLRELDPDAARVAMLVAAHDAVLFEGTVAQNITAVHQPEPERWVAVLAAAQADEVAEALPHGVDTMVAERGRSLSGGQRQRVALARALAADAPVLVLHDPTTAVDAVTEARIADGLRAVRAGRTTLLLTTSPALLATADRVVLLDGRVRAEGTHVALLDNPDYRVAVLT